MKECELYFKQNCLRPDGDNTCYDDAGVCKFAQIKPCCSTCLERDILKCYTCQEEKESEQLDRLNTLAKESKLQKGITNGSDNG